MAEKKKIVRLADVGELENILKKDLAEEEAKGKDADTLFCENVAGELTDLESLPTIDPERIIPAWRDPDKDRRRSKPKFWFCTGVMTIWALQRRTTRTAMFSPRTANGIGKTFPIGGHTTRSGTTTESRKAGGNAATSTRTTFTTTR